MQLNLHLKKVFIEISVGFLSDSEVDQSSQLCNNSNPSLLSESAVTKNKTNNNHIRTALFQIFQKLWPRIYAATNTNNTTTTKVSSTTQVANITQP